MNNPPAFPSKKRIFKAGYSTSEFEPVDGMTLRDYFAAKAMQEFIGVLGLTDGTKKAYEWADAMLKVR
jgi:hypothetical protein